MLIYGSKAIHLGSSKPKTGTFPSCESTGSITLNVYRRHSHIFWIPLFPMGKLGRGHCENCNTEFKPKKLDESHKQAYLRLKSESRGPIWQWAGLAIFVCFVIGAVVASNVQDKRELEYLAAPESGDIYRYKAGYSSYTTFKVVRVDTDSLYIMDNSYEVDKYSGIYKIDKEENYMEPVYGVSREQVLEMHEAGDIMRIER
ncbi:hypothetical protein [Gilvibacter sp.]|uniref:hypothetical protein n=1 Tax=Gilvibacter sp. TaxID=2729997 RepID=UPI0025B9B2DA|nr:hypothetical protein [Gilvibacter sp.]NQX77118.1 hypothetical protein [Gilvibacter sp.]